MQVTLRGQTSNNTNRVNTNRRGEVSIIVTPENSGAVDLPTFAGCVNVAVSGASGDVFYAYGEGVELACVEDDSTEGLADSSFQVCKSKIVTVWECRGGVVAGDSISMSLEVSEGFV